jgi:hypothetical protein
MEATKIEALEAYFKTKNEHYNSYSFNLLVETLKSGLFDDPELPLMFFSNAIELACLLHETPVRAAAIIQEEINRQTLSPEQAVFLLDWIAKYLKQSEFDDSDPEGVLRLIKAHIDRLKHKISERPENRQPMTGNIRLALKRYVESELEQLPETMKGLDPAQRMSILCKLLPYAMPKTASVESSFGESRKMEILW